MGFQSWKTSLRRRLSASTNPATPLQTAREYWIGYRTSEICLERVTVEKCGLIRVEGWIASSKSGSNLLPKCFFAGKEIPQFQIFRTYRPDVAVTLNSQELFPGITILYRLPDQPDPNAMLKLEVDGHTVLETEGHFEIRPPHYGGLIDLTQVLHREHIYGFGPPSTEVSGEVVALCRMLPEPILDFGCGTGALIRALRCEKLEVYGIELSREPIINGLLADVKDRITLGDGRLPLPFADGEFNSVVAIEVIEHLPDFELALSEIARITRRDFIVTVPDMSSVPLCYYESVVPWHLLEGTHVNFFNQSSLEATLKKYFSHVEMARIGRMSTNGTTWYTSLAGICRK